MLAHLVWIKTMYVSKTIAIVIAPSAILVLRRDNLDYQIVAKEGF